MTVSSSDEDREFYPTPEFRNLLITTKRIRREFARLGRQLPRSTPLSRLEKSIDDLEESLKVHFKELYGFERDMAAIASTRLTKKQAIMLRWMSENYREETVYTSLIERISDAMGVPKSTVRWNMRGLREAGLISAGDKRNKGVPVKLTERGSIMAECIGTSAD